jgi:hypothetical protein
MATFKQEPGPFDKATKEELNEWLGHPVTEMLLAQLKQTIAQLDDAITGHNPFTLSDAALGEKVRNFLMARANVVSMLEWVKGAQHAA